MIKEKIIKEAAKDVVKSELLREYKKMRATVKRYMTITKNMGFSQNLELPSVPNKITRGSIKKLEKFYNELHKEREIQIITMKENARKEILERIEELEKIADDYVSGEKLGNVGFDNYYGASTGTSVFKEWARDMLDIAFKKAKRLMTARVSTIKNGVEMEKILNAFSERIDNSWNDLEDMIENVILAMYKAHKKKTAYWNYDKENYNFQGQMQTMALINSIEQILTLGA